MTEQNTTNFDVLKEFFEQPQIQSGMMSEKSEGGMSLKRAVEFNLADADNFASSLTIVSVMVALDPLTLTHIVAGAARIKPFVHAFNIVRETLNPSQENVA